MTRFLLDTNIVSELVRPAPSPHLLEWMDRQRQADLFLAAMSVAEVKYGLLCMPTGRRRTTLEDWFDGPTGLLRTFAGRILAFDEEASIVWAHLMAEGRQLGTPRDPTDMVIAATAQRFGCFIATANESDFVGIDLVNPLRVP